jgi:hypothetical protein
MPKILLISFENINTAWKKLILISISLILSEKNIMILHNLTVPCKDIIKSKIYE